MSGNNSKTVVITKFNKETGYGFLSNFHTGTIYVDGLAYPSVEHAYQAYKTLDVASRELIRKSKSPAEAKKLGRCLPLREDWDSVKVDLMREFIKKKFENPFLRPLLLATGDAELVNDNTWNDTFFGVCRGVGQNWLGIILMEERERIRKDEGDENTST